MEQHKGQRVAKHPKRDQKKKGKPPLSLNNLPNAQVTADPRYKPPPVNFRNPHSTLQLNQKIVNCEEVSPKLFSEPSVEAQRVVEAGVVEELVVLEEVVVMEHRTTASKKGREREDDGPPLLSVEKVEAAVSKALEYAKTSNHYPSVHELDSDLRQLGHLHNMGEVIKTPPCQGILTEILAHVQKLFIGNSTSWELVQQLEMRHEAVDLRFDGRYCGNNCEL